VRLGSLDVTALVDGSVDLPPEFFPGADWEVHRDLLTDGVLRVPVGCFLVRGGGTTVLIDAGLGPRDGAWFEGGRLIGELARAGVAPADVDLVVCTHLHFDHIGGVLQDGVPVFPNAAIRFGAQEVDQFASDPSAGETTRAMLEALRTNSSFELISHDGELAPGVSTLHAPGHTLGHRCVVLSSGDQRLFLLGDAVHCPVQISETEWEAIADVDKDLARRTRETLFREIESAGAMMSGAHFPGLQFGRVLRGEGKRYFA